MYIGIDLGGTNIAAGIVNNEGTILFRASIPTGAHRPADEIVADMSALCLGLLKEANISIDEIEAVGIASPGVANHDTGVVEYANNLPFKNFPMAEIFKKYLPVSRIYIANDANAEMIHEAAIGRINNEQLLKLQTLGLDTEEAEAIIVEGFLE